MMTYPNQKNEIAYKGPAIRAGSRRNSGGTAWGAKRFASLSYLGLKTVTYYQTRHD